MEIYRRIGLVCCRIPYGRAATYGQIALLCGKPGNSRQVGYALRRGLAGEVPAHRVVGTGGYLTGAASFDFSGEQQILLEREGVEVYETVRGAKIDLKIYGWKNTMEEAETLAKEFVNAGI